jgi:hypothetical protein
MTPAKSLARRPPRSEARSGTDDICLSADLAVTSALCTLVLVAAAGFTRVYAGSSWALPVMTTVAAGSVATFVARRAGLRSSAGAIGGLLAIWVTSSDLVLRSSTQAGFPLLGTLRAASGASRQAAAALMASVAPVHALPGFVLWAAWGAGASVVAADWLAFRLRSMGAIIPPLFVFLATCVLGVPAGRTWALASFIAAAMCFALLHQWALGVVGTKALRSKGVARDAHGLSDHRSPGRPKARRLGPVTPGGVVLVAVAVLAGLVCVPVLGNDGSGPTAWRQNFETAVRVAPDPLVSLQANLLESSRTPMFVVHSTVAAYWRLTSLQHFDGTNWTGSGSYREVHNNLPGTEVLAGTEQVIETFHIEELGSPWLPVAFQPETVSLGAPVSYDPTSGSLLTGSRTADGETYRVVAAESLAALTPALLSRVRKISAKDRSELTEFLQLPRGIPTSVVQLARTLVPASASEYQKALALQEFFHRSPFVYTLGPPQGDNTTGALVSFLFRTHAGYCQQYAAAYAVLARLAGLPARVAVGFSTGTPIGPHAWQVLGLDAHAWPEVWFPSVGWVPFEPTPTFRIPGAPQYAGLTGQARSGAGTPAPTTVPNATSRPPPAVARGGIGHPARSRLAGGDTRRRLFENLLLVVITLLVAIVAWAILVRTGELLRWQRRRRRLVPGVFFNALPIAARDRGTALARRRRRRPTSDEEEALGWLLVTWEELSEELGRSGLPRRASETPAEWVRRAGEALGRRGALSSDEQNALVEIGEALSNAAYGRWRPGAAQVRTLREACNQVRQHAREVLQWRQRLRRYIDPRTAWRPVTGPALPKR